ncbi:hypothetical protein DKL61_08650 [Gammaproteobacteria bacterium ESL0073]|nr:hypothetical protein DKL61_08650 [Gammaproteobacteria bacterium ESL0073]
MKLIILSIFFFGLIGCDNKSNLDLTDNYHHIDRKFGLKKVQKKCKPFLDEYSPDKKIFTINGFHISGYGFTSIELSFTKEGSLCVVSLKRTLPDNDNSKTQIKQDFDRLNNDLNMINKRPLHSYTINKDGMAIAQGGLDENGHVIGWGNNEYMRYEVLTMWSKTLRDTIEFSAYFKNTYEKNCFPSYFSN